MKILFFSTYYLPYISGITTYPHSVFSKLARDYEIEVLTYQHNKNLPFTEKINGYSITRIPYTFRVFKAFVSIQAVYFFLKKIAQADIVMINLPNTGGLILVILSRLMGKKIIVFFYCQIKFQNGILKKIMALMVNCLTYFQMFFANKIITLTRDYANSTLAAKLFQNKFNYSLPLIEKKPLNEIYLNKLLKEKGDELWIGCVGRVSREKGLSILIKAISGFSDKLNVRLVIAGPYGKMVSGEEDYYHSLLSMLKKEKIRYQFLGKLEDDELGAFYKAINILVLPSTNSTEAFGMVQVEAMLLGTPVIASDLPGVRVPVQLTGMGKIIPVGNHKKMRDAIQLLIENNRSYSSELKIKKVHQLFSGEQNIEFIKRLLLKQ